jgi:hypothetical protein
MALLTYDEARPWAKAIRDQVVARTMPPWGAVKGVGSFQNDPSLTEVEIQMLVAWVEGGAPKGDDAEPPPYKPPAPPKTKPAPVRKTQLISGDTTLERPLILQGIRPESLGDGQSMQLDAWYPDGRIEHLIWLPNYQAAWTRDYLYRTPLKLPAGTIIHLKANQSAKAKLLY